MEKVKAKENGLDRDKLIPTAKQRYLEKLLDIKHTSSPAAEWHRDLNHLPPCTCIDIVNYLVFGVSYYTMQEFKSHKSLESYKAFCCGWVQDLAIYEPPGGENCVVLAKNAAAGPEDSMRTASMVRQYIDGFNYCGGFWGVVEKNCKAFLPIFCHTETLTRQNMQALFKVKWSTAGSNRRDLEEETIFCWECLLMAIHQGSGSISFAEILVFVTGEDAMSPLGFDPAPSIDFYNQVEGERRLPFASACSMILSLQGELRTEQSLTNS